ncbi:phospholipase D domain protein [Marvinbryantia formatexigens DSM 14469]|uniref:Phospholipase D domain protein n=1 Tax=Marvinbryantia formatexigens DSM 14469 TaxID=478749 RepID=C6LM05_9FIRM|nr:phospholipase D domain protein [Marvinbryantia formatexigens DSM 14469]
MVAAGERNQAAGSLPSAGSGNAMLREYAGNLLQNRAGVKIYEYTSGFIHAKNFVCDDRFAVCGTINLDYRSLAHHYECGVWMYRTG